MQKKTFKSLLTAGALCAVFATFAGCSFAPVCNLQGAYADGVNDGRYRNPENFNYAATCPARRGRINRAYHRGYRRGLHMAPVVTPVIVPVAPAPAPSPWGPRPRPWGPRPNPWHPHGGGGHHGGGGRHGGGGHHPHRHVIPGVPTPPVQTHVVQPNIPGVPTPSTHHMTMSVIK